jgi:hypothetical protein
MRHRRPGEGIAGFRGSRRAALALIAAGMGLVGCGGIDAFAPEMDDIVRPSQLKYEETNLTPTALADRMREIDEAYAEPRTPAKVSLSLETSTHSISKVNGYAALWRGTRACAWLARNLSDRSQREAFALKGISIGREAAKKASTNVESFYYLALSLGAFAELKGTPARDIVREMRDMMLMAKSLDEKFDYCGPHRFLGLLMVKSDAYPLYAVGNAATGLKHLETATKLCPDYGENHLVYAQALVEEGEDELARAEAEKVLQSMKPEDLTAEHDRWLEEANDILQGLQGS